MVSKAKTAHDSVNTGEIAIGVIIGRTSEFFDFFVYAIASVVVFPKLVFPYVDPLTGTLYSFAIFALAFIVRPIGTTIFMAVDRAYGRGIKLTISLFLLGTSTVAVAFLPGHDQIGSASAWLLAFFRIGQGLSLGGTWDGLAPLLALNVPAKRRGWYAMIPQLGAPLGLMVASALFAFFINEAVGGGFSRMGLALPVLCCLCDQCRCAVRAASHRRHAANIRSCLKAATSSRSPLQERCGPRDAMSLSARLRRSQASRCFTW